MSSAAVEPSPKSNPPRSTKGVRTRARLLEAAKDVFEELGFLDTRVSDISDRAGLSHGSFYHYFESKEQIFRELAEEIDAKLTAGLSDIILAPGLDIGPVERLREALRSHFESYRAEARMMGVIEQAARYDEVFNATRAARNREYSAKITDSIRRLQRRGLADPDLDPVLTAAAVGAVTYRFAELWLVQDAVDCTLDDATEHITRFLANAMGLPADGDARGADRGARRIG